MRSATKTLALAVLGFLTLITLLLVYGRERPPQVTYQLNDGTTVYLKAVTFGKKHQVSKNMWVSWFPFPKESYDQVTERESLVFWLFLEPKTARNTVAYNWSTLNTVLDENGCWVLQQDSKSSTFGPRVRPGVPESKLYVKPIIVEAFPRRGKKLVLRLADVRGSEPTLEFEADNPVRKEFPEWKADSLPLTRTIGNVTLTLDELTTDKPLEPGVRPAVGRPHYTRANFSIREAYIPTNAWEPVEISISDATGNEVTNRNDGHDFVVVLDKEKSGKIVVEMTRGLCPLEPVWKMRVKLMKSPSEILVFEFAVRPTVRG